MTKDQLRKYLDNLMKESKRYLSELTGPVDVTPKITKRFNEDGLGMWNGRIYSPPAGRLVRLSDILPKREIR